MPRYCSKAMGDSRSQQMQPLGGSESGLLRSQKIIILLGYRKSRFIKKEGG